MCHRNRFLRLLLSWCSLKILEVPEHGSSGRVDRANSNPFVNQQDYRTTPYQPLSENKAGPDVMVSFVLEAINLENDKNASVLLELW